MVESTRNWEMREHGEHPDGRSIEVRHMTELDNSLWQMTEPKL